MAGIIGHFLKVVQKSGFVVQYRYIFYNRNHAFQIPGITAESVRNGWRRINRQDFIFKNIAIIQNKVFSRFDVVIVAGLYFALFGNFFHIQVSVFWFLPEKIAVAVNPVIQRNRIDFYPVVFINFLRIVFIQLMVNHFKATVGFGNRKNGFQHFLDSLRSVYMQRRFSSQQPERRNKSRQAETMVSVKMGNENMVDFRKFRLRFSQLNLRSFPTVDQERPLLHFQELGGRGRIYGRNRRIKA